MKTITLQVSNTDNKLTQQEWSDFVSLINNILGNSISITLHFFGGSSTWVSCQNCCWVFDTEDGDYIKEKVTEIRGCYKQDSAAWTEGDTQFI